MLDKEIDTAPSVPAHEAPGSDDTLRLDALSGTHVDFYQDIPPVPAARDETIRSGLVALSRVPEIMPRFRSHRYTGVDTDRDAAAQWVARRLGGAPDASRVVLTHGTQSALLMLLSRLVGPGALLFTEGLTYPSVKPLARLLGMELRGVPMDEDGLLPDAFEQACRDRRPKALYCMPTIHNPTTTYMSVQRQGEIADIARRHGVVVLEDDAYGLFSDRPPATLTALAPDITWYLCSLAKPLAVQLRVTLVVAPTEAAAIDAFGPTLRMTHWMAAPLSAEMVSLWIRNGHAAKLLEEVRNEAQARQAAAAETLRNWTYQTDPRSLHLWLRLPEPWSRQGFVAAAREAGVLVGSSDAFAVPPCAPPEAVRVCLGAPTRRAAVIDGLSILDRVLSHGAPQ